ncbi:astacin-like metalloendopeptidase [Elephas maximus indicus]|uniref:astacin-like metalloendopeptidase n=1 Tax=Elephas maximus indicus TaxID=99487 RepID=UPI0021167289|nr:astacin-like metalloendopeptidase [Elephas maximus indicus]
MGALPEHSKKPAIGGPRGGSQDFRSPWDYRRPAWLEITGLILGASDTSSCPGACDTSSPEDLTSEDTQGSWDRDIPAINQGLIPEETPESGFLLEGDIIRPSPFQLFSAASNKWPKSSSGLVEVPFLLSSEYNELSRQVILKAFAEFERLTCIRFVSYDGQRDFISIVPMSGCFSNVGRSGGMQVVSLAPACLQRGPGIALHELMHVLGFWHEHARADRDRYIRVNWDEVLPGYEINFLKARSSNMLVPYDYLSVMHYGRLAFSRRGIPTLLPLWDPSIHIGQRWNLSALDVTRVLRLYDCRPSGHSPPERDFQAPSGGRSPTPASRPHLQRLLKALLVEPRGPHLSGSKTGGQHITAGAGENSPGRKPSTQEKFSTETPARPPQALVSTPSSRPGAGAPGVVLEWPWLTQVPTVPPAPSLEGESQPAPVQAALGNPALPGGHVPGNHFRGMPSGQTQVGRESSAQRSGVAQPVAPLGSTSFSSSPSRATFSQRGRALSCLAPPRARGDRQAP